MNREARAAFRPRSAIPRWQSSPRQKSSQPCPMPTGSRHGILAPGTKRLLKQSLWTAIAAAAPCLGASPLCGAELAAVEAIAAGHTRVVPLVKHYCQDCHAGDLIEGDVDLSGVTSLDTVRRQVKVWQRVAEMVSSRQMPPPEADQPTDEERAEIGQWLHDFLKAEARAGRATRAASCSAGSTMPNTPPRSATSPVSIRSILHGSFRRMAARARGLPTRASRS